MSLDRYLEQPYADEAYRQEEYSEAFDEQVDYIEKCFKANEPIKYNGLRQIYPDNCDFSEYIFERQAEILQIMANRDDAGLLKLMKSIYDHNMEQLVDLTL